MTDRVFTTEESTTNPPLRFTIDVDGDGDLRLRATKGTQLETLLYISADTGELRRAYVGASDLERLGLTGDGAYIRIGENY